MTISNRFVAYYMDVAERSAQLSYATILQVGAVIVVDNGIISTGFNGTPKGEPNSCEHYVDGQLVTLPNVIHAEDNAIRRVYERNLCAHGASIFITHAPCLKCSQKILASGIKEVFYKNDYKNHYGINFLSDHYVKVRKI
jgi:dCMP deaminase